MKCKVKMLSQLQYTAITNTKITEGEVEYEATSPAKITEGGKKED